MHGSTIYEGKFYMSVASIPKATCELERMLTTDADVELRQDRTVPIEIYASLVDSLYGDARSLFMGSIGACVASLISSCYTGAPALFACSIAIAVLSIARAFLMQAYVRHRSRLATRAQLRPWETRYIVGASAYVLFIGLFCLASFVVTTDSFVRLLGFVSILAYMIGTAGRNFSNTLLVNAQIVCALVPMTLALALSGPVYWIMIFVVLPPFFLSVKSIALRLQGILLNASIKAHDLALLAGRFDTALNNMPQGLTMLNADGGIVVLNRKLAEWLRLEHPNAYVGGASIDRLIGDCADHGVVSRSRALALIAEFRSRFANGGGEDALIEPFAGRTLSFRFQAMDNGGLVILAEDMTERQSTEARIKYLACFDALTGLSNGAVFRDQVEARLVRYRASGTPSALLFIDLDQFKQVNDTLGHTRGDMLLCDVADRIRSMIETDDIVARFGGDEFVLLHPLKVGDDNVGHLARTIIERLSRPYLIEGRSVVIGASIGIATTRTGELEVDILLKNADMALFRAKAEGRNTWRSFEPIMDQQARARRDIEFDLRRALANHEFELHFQPIYSLRTKTFSVCEALIRWRHPERGLVSPSEFVSIAEEMGLIVDIGAWVLREACIECARWPTDVRVAVNISPVQFRQDGLVGMVQQALRAANLAPQRLEIEITESVLLQNLELTLVALNQLREIGVRISLDDFGTGYSSLCYLQSLPLQKVKIDRSFLQGLGSNDRTLVLLRGVARLSAELGMLVVLEGIETEEQFALVAAEVHVDEVQGYYFSRPRPAVEIHPLLEAQIARVA